MAKTAAAQRSHRDPATIRNIMLRMSAPYVEKLDRLCSINQRSRREIVELLVTEALLEYEHNNDYRIDPF